MRFKQSDSLGIVCGSQERCRATRAVGWILSWGVLCGFLSGSLARGDVPLDVSQFSPSCGVVIERPEGELNLAWPIGGGQRARWRINTSGQGKLIASIRVEANGASGGELLSDLDPVVYLTVGQRQTPPAKPLDRSWDVFFDNPQRRPHQTYAGRVQVERLRLTSTARRATLAIDSVTAGPFKGHLELTFFADSPLVRLDFVLRTAENGLAMFYDAGLLTSDVRGRQLQWRDTQGATQEITAEDSSPFTPLAVRHRTLVVAAEQGALACFSPPHQFQFPRDWTDNLRYVWYGRNHHGLTDEFGFGIRQQKDGGGNFVPWFNAPPEVWHRMGMFLLVSGNSGAAAFEQVLRYTNGDRFVALPGYLTMASHWHMAIAVAAMKERQRGFERTEPPEYVDVLKGLGLNLVHLAEFHGDGHQHDPGPLRLPEMESMFRECRRWSDERFLLIPGEEINTYLGLTLEGKHPGHWMSLFPRPVYWTLKRGPEEPFVEQRPPYGSVYHVGNRADMVRLIKEEGALVWAAHPRIKASSWTPDIFRHEDFFIADYWLGGAWKAMPGDLSRERLGERVLNLLDDMANWGHKKYVLGEVDVFKIDSTHELYGHMNVNYLQMDRVPRFDEGWQAVLDTLRDGKFFVTTGEVLLPTFSVGGKGSGEEVVLADPAAAELRAEMRWTFPLAFAEVISGDGQRVHRQRIDLSATLPFGEQLLQLPVDLRGRRWVRLEVWDVACNGAFTQPVWIRP